MYCGLSSRLHQYSILRTLKSIEYTLATPWTILWTFGSLLCLIGVLCGVKAAEDSPEMSVDFVVSDSVKCYSCMSKSYEVFWDQLKLGQYFKRPLNFTDACDSGRSQKGVGLVDCNSICIRFREESVLLGRQLSLYARGCYSSMLVHGFNQSIVKDYRWLQRDSCRWYNQHHVFMQTKRADAQAKGVHLCTCYQDGCNGTPTLYGSVDRLLAAFRTIFLAVFAAVLSAR